MKKFLLVTATLLVLALLLVIVVFWYVSSQLVTSEIETPVSSIVDTVLEIEAEPVSNVPDPVAEAAPLVEVYEVPESALSEDQKDVLNSVGIDASAITITAKQIACAEEKLAAGRVAEIVAGDTPSVLEIARLTPCLVVE